MKNSLFPYSFFLLFILLLSCNDDPVLTPKPRGYPKIVYPERSYQQFTESYCDFTFEYPGYAKVIQDTLFFNDKPIHPCWFDVYIPDFDAKVHCTYFQIDQKNSFEKLRDDSFKLANKHTMKASFIDEFKIEKPNNVSGFAFNIEGAAASPFQFFLSDSTEHFVRGSLYFNTKINPDSLAPVVEFVKYDIMHMINSFAWEGPVIKVTNSRPASGMNR